MTEDNKAFVKRVREYEQPATEGPWFAKATDDKSCMNMLYIDILPGDSRHDSEIYGHRPGRTIAIILHQMEPCVNIEDGKWEENTAFITGARMDLPDAMDRIEALEKTLDYLQLDVIKQLEAENKEWRTLVEKQSKELAKETKTLDDLVRAQAENERLRKEHDADDARFKWMRENMIQLERKFFQLEMQASDSGGRDHIDIRMWEGWEHEPKHETEIDGFDWRAAIGFVMKHDWQPEEEGKK